MHFSVPGLSLALSLSRGFCAGNQRRVSRSLRGPRHGSAMIMPDLVVQITPGNRAEGPGTVAGPRTRQASWIAPPSLANRGRRSRDRRPWPASALRPSVMNVVQSSRLLPFPQLSDANLLPMCWPASAIPRPSSRSSRAWKPVKAGSRITNPSAPSPPRP